MAQRFKPEVHAFIAAHVAGTPTSELAEMTNAAFGTNFTAASMKSYKANHKLKNNRGTGQIKGKPTKAFPANVREYIFSHYKGTGHRQMCEQLFEQFSVQYTPEQIKQYYARNGLNSGLTGYFKKGHCPYRPKPGVHAQGCEKTWFKPGQTPHNIKPIGYERTTRDGYIEVKIKMRKSRPGSNDNFAPKHRIIWEREHGPLPPGYVIVFKDGNRQNLDPDNLAAVTKQERLDMNRHDLFSSDPQATETGILLARLRTTASQKEKEIKNGENDKR